MKRGVNSLATIASIAPLLGFLGTFMGVANSFLGVCPRNTLVSKQVGRRPEMILAGKEFTNLGRPGWTPENRVGMTNGVVFRYFLVV
jgi:hypothetical protein